MKVSAIKSQGEYGSSAIKPGPAGGPSPSDDQLDSNRHDRGYNPIDSAERGTVSGKLNEDAARYRKGPAPV